MWIFTSFDKFLALVIKIFRENSISNRNSFENLSRTSKSPTGIDRSLPDKRKMQIAYTTKPVFNHMHSTKELHKNRNKNVSLPQVSEAIKTNQFIHTQ